MGITTSVDVMFSHFKERASFTRAAVYLHVETAALTRDCNSFIIASSCAVVKVAVWPDLLVFGIVCSFMSNSKSDLRWVNILPEATSAMI